MDAGAYRLVVRDAEGRVIRQRERRSLIRLIVETGDLTYALDYGRRQFPRRTVVAMLVR